MMGIPKSEYGKLRKRILDDAAELVGISGFDSLTLLTVGQFGGVPRHQMAYYFVNAETLLFHLIDGALMEVLNALGPIEDMAAEAGLQSLCRSYVEAMGAGVPRRLPQAPIGRLAPRHQEVIRFKRSWLRVAFEDAIGNCRPGPDPARVSALARSLIASLDGYAGWRGEPGVMEPADFAGLMCSMIVSAVPPASLRLSPGT